MKTYYVPVRRIAIELYAVEAENKKEAKEKAWVKATCNERPDAQLKEVPKKSKMVALEGTIPHNWEHELPESVRPVNFSASMSDDRYIDVSTTLLVKIKAE